MLAKLADALANDFEDADLSRLIVSRAGIEDRLVRYDSLPVMRWQTIVELASRQNKLEALVKTAVELTGHSALRELLPVTPHEPAA